MKLFNRKGDRTKSCRFMLIGLMMITLAGLVIVIDPVQVIVDYKLSMRPGSLLYELWQKPPLDVYIKVYVFNITNYDRFISGYDGKVKVEEIGPYVYQEFLENRDPIINHIENKITYKPKRKVKFIREMSVGDPKVDTISVPNIPYMGVTSAASDLSMMLAIPVRILMTRLRSQVILRNVTVEDYFWGYDDPLVKLASDIIPSVIHFRTFGLLDRMFDEGENIVKMNLPQEKSPYLPTEDMSNVVSDNLISEQYLEKDSSINSIMSAIRSLMPKTKKYFEPFVPVIRDFSIDSWNGESGLKYWGYREGKEGNTECNTLRGTYDGTLFPRNISKGETFRIYRKAFCRTLPIVYSHPGTVDGVDAYYFKLADNAFDSDINDPQSSCYCSKGVCLKKGLGNITPCYYNIPAAISFPHFYNADPSLVNDIEGMHPDPEKHGSEIVLQPQLGVPMKVHSRFQLNLLMSDIKFNSDMRPFKNTVLPIIWLEIGVESLTSDLLLLLRILFNIAPYVQFAILFVLVSIGISTISIGLLLLFWIPKHIEEFNVKSWEFRRYSAMVILPLLRRQSIIKHAITQDDEFLTPIREAV